MTAKKSSKPPANVAELAPYKGPAVDEAQRLEALTLVHEAHQRIEMASRITGKLGLGSGGAFGLFGDTERERSMSAALFVAWRTTQLLCAWLQYGENWPADGDIVRAANIIRGGANASSSAGHDLTMAISMGGQAIMMRNGFAFPQVTDGEVVDFVRRGFADLFGDAFLSADANVILESIPREVPRKWRDDQQRFFEHAGVTLARDVVWAVRPLKQVAPSVFRFPLVPSDTAKSKFLSRLQQHARRSMRITGK